jgi:hypothetical protein
MDRNLHGAKFALHVSATTVVLEILCVLVIGL